MAVSFWRPGAPAPGPGIWKRKPGPALPPAGVTGVLISDLDRDADRHRALPVFNPRSGLPLRQQREQLTIHRHRLQVLHALETHRAVVLCGPTGCGKSTQLPQYLDEAGWTADGYVVGVTLPRRIATMTVAGRVAQEMNSELGGDVGYRIRFDNRVTSGQTRIEFMTEGVLLREMLSDPLLTRYSVVVVDEAHERSMQTDLLLGLLVKIARKRPRLRLVVASATLDVEGVLRFLCRHFTDSRRGSGAALQMPARKRPRCGWDDDTGEFHRQREEDRDWRQLCSKLGGDGGSMHGGADHGAAEQDVCLVAVEGRAHDVKVQYLEEPACDYVESAVGTVLAIHSGEPEGDILLFLTGREEIEAVCAMLRERIAQEYERAPTPQKRPRPLDAVPLHGSLPKEAQLKAFLPGQRGARKVVVSTNLAEASVTIDGIVYVVDACLVKLDTFCPHNGVSYLNIAPCSRAASRQRAGRAGRTCSGKCYRLVMEADFAAALPEHTVPEIARSDLRGTVLLLKCLGVDDVGAFEFISPPSRAALEVALEDLFALGAIDGEARVVEPLGVQMAHGPLPPQLMRLLLLAADPAHACAAEAAVVCAMLTLQSPWLLSASVDRLHACRQSFAVYEGDLVTLLNVQRQYEVHIEQDPEWAKRHLLNSSLLERAGQVRQQLLHYLQRFELPIESCGHDAGRVQRVVCAALFLNAARRTPTGAYRLCRPIDEPRAPHSRFLLHPSSVLAGVQGHAPADFIVFVEARATGAEADLLQCTRVKPEWLPDLAPHYFREVDAGLAVADT